MKECIAGKSGLPFSLGVIAEGKFLFVSGLGPFDPVQGKMVRGSIAEQTTLTLEYLQSFLKRTGACMQDVVRCRVFLQPLTDETFAEMNGAYSPFFATNQPARTTVGCQLLNIDVEIDCTVRMPG